MVLDKIAIQLGSALREFTSIMIKISQLLFIK